MKKLAAETPARFVAFDLPAGEDGRPLLALRFEERRKRLEAFARRQLKRNRCIEFSPSPGIPPRPVWREYTRRISASECRSDTAPQNSVV